MSLPVPNLDDRRFQDLVDDAKRLVQQRAPQWTDHNVSDPGVTLIELFAWMTDQVIYRLNRVPARNYVKFLELLDVQLFPPTAARAAITFWLTAPQPDTVRIPAGTQVATVRTETDEAIVFETLEDLAVVATGLEAVASGTSSSTDGTGFLDHAESLARRTPFPAFSQVPEPGDAMYVGLTRPAPSCAVAMVFRCDIAGVGVQPDWPPLVWEAWDGDDWRECPVDRDETGGLNQDGMVVIHLPRAHLMSTLSGRRAGWIRVRITEPEPDQPMYEGSPTITEVSVSIVGGTVDAANAELVDEEDLGPAEGIPGQRWELRRRPLVPGDAPPVLEVSTEDGWQEWTLESDFASSGPEDRHFVLDVAEGSVSLGPGVRLADGTFRRYGAVPAKGARARLRHFRTGGGERGNVSAGTLSVLKSSIPYVARVENRRAAQGGVDGEGIENAKRRAPVALRTRGRAVTTEDFEHLAREAAPEAARIRAVQATDPSDAGAVRVLVVPFVAAEAGRVSFDQLVPADETLQAVTDRLEECRIIGTRVLVEPPLYRGVTVEARLHARARANPVRVQSAALDAVFAYLNPITGGPEKAGWPFGRAVNVGEIYGVLQGIPGTEVVDDVRIFPSDPVTGARGGAVNRLVLEPNALVFSHEHRVDVEGG